VHTPERRTRRLAAALTAALLAVAGLSACSTEKADASVAVTGTDDACEIAEDRLDAGRVAFEFTNEADDISELYVLRDNGDVVSEVENVTTGTRRTLTVDLAAGDYEVRCKPGQTGDGYSSPFEVTGEGGEAQAEPDRQVDVTAVDFAYPGLDIGKVTSGQTLRFEMTNDGTQQHEFEVLGPDGEAVGEVAAMDPGATGGATITLSEPGEYRYQCILVDPATKQPHTELGMTGTFQVDPA
jgi:plastocyanin